MLGAADFVKRTIRDVTPAARARAQAARARDRSAINQRTRTLERVPNELRRESAPGFMLGHIFCGRRVSAAPKYAAGPDALSSPSPWLPDRAGQLMRRTWQ